MVLLEQWRATIFCFNCGIIATVMIFKYSLMDLCNVSLCALCLLV